MGQGYATAARIDREAIPVVDIAPLRSGANPEPVAAALHAASQQLGFIYVSGHGIDEALITNARAEAFRFFRADAAQRESVAISGAHRGWLAVGGARMGDDEKADLKESFLWGDDYDNASVPDDHPLRGVNQWPTQNDVFRSVSMAYFHAAQQVARDLMRGFALGLQLDQDFFIRSDQASLSRASYVYYPQQTPDMGEDQFGVAPHTDFGVLTVLCQDDVGGLQVQNTDGAWIQAPPIPGTLVVNVADLLSRWTAGAYKSTPHRVINASGKERLSIVLAYDPDPDTLIDARDVHGPDVQAAAPIACGDYLTWRFGKAFAYRERTA